MRYTAAVFQYVAKPQWEHTASGAIPANAEMFPNMDEEETKFQFTGSGQDWSDWLDSRCVLQCKSEEEKILSYLSEYYDEEKSTVIKHSLKDLFEDIQDRETIQKFEANGRTTRFLSAEEILKEIV